MNKRIMALLLIFAFSFSVSAAADNIIINGSFDGGQSSFTGILPYTDAEAADGTCGLVANIIYTNSDGSAVHEAFYDYQADLTEGVMYEFSIRIKSGAPSMYVPEMKTTYDSLGAQIVFSISGIGTSWSTLTGRVIAGSSGQYNLKLLFTAASATANLLVDSITLKEGSERPTHMRISGPKEVLVPDAGTMSYSYQAVGVDAAGKTMSVIGLISFDANLPQGITASGNTIRVSSGAQAGAEFNVYAAAPPGLEYLQRASIAVTTSYNYIENGSFEDFPDLSGYRVSVGAARLDEQEGRKRARLESAEVSESSFVSEISIDKTYLLSPGNMYVLRAVVYSQPGYSSRQTETTQGEVGLDGSIKVSISDIGSEETTITSVIEVSREGIYQIDLSFINPDGRIIYIKQIGLYKETARATDVIFNAPAHVTIPKSGSVSVPIDYIARDQRGSVLPNEAVYVSVEPEGQGVSLSGKTLTVSGGAKEGIYRLCAVTPSHDDVYSVHNVTVSNASVGDGGFEEQAAGQWFSTAEPSVLTMTSLYMGTYPYSGDKMAKLTMDGSVSAVLSDSVFRYTAGEAYVFSGYFKRMVTDIDTVASIIIYNAWGDNMAVLQFEIGDGLVSKVFVPPTDITGRLMIGFTTAAEHNSQVILMDELSVEAPEVYASGVSIVGYPYPQRLLTGRHTFSANFDTQELSSYRWLLSSAKDGVYMPIDGETTQSLSVTEDMLGSYVKFEVTPSSLSGPVYGKSSASSAVEIQTLPSSGNAALVWSDSADHEADEEKKTVVESSDLINKGGLLGVVNIYSESFSSPAYFVDTLSHWAKEDIDLLSAANIINGRGNMLFSPDETITRAEFSAFLMRAFSLAPLYYTEGFSDVHYGDWYSGVVETVTKYNIAQGVEANVFAPSEPITREQMTIMIVRALRLAGIVLTDAGDLYFTDAHSISAWAREALELASRADLISGFPDGRIAPRESATRAQAICIIRRMLSYVINS